MQRGIKIFFFSSPELAKASVFCYNSLVIIIKHKTMDEGETRYRPEEPEHVHTPEEVLAIFESFLEGRAYTETRRQVDEKGLLLLEITVPGENGHYKEYTFSRQPLRPREGEVGYPYMHVASYDETGFPETGYSVGKFINGKWELTP
ncbi:MAG: hypothetical protein WCW16_03180 [Candidatus Magasanikbacteria bacterium]